MSISLIKKLFIPVTIASVSTTILTFKYGETGLIIGLAFSLLVGLTFRLIFGKAS